MVDQTPPPDQSTLEGVAPDIREPDRKATVIEQAFDYRGDVTLKLADGSMIEGYIFDRRRGQDPSIRVMRAADGISVQLRYAEIQAIRFSGRDTAAGKSWESWVNKKHQEKKKLGQPAILEPDASE